MAGTQDEPVGELPDVDGLWDEVLETVLLPRMSFELDVASTLPGGTAPVVARRTGSFDDDTLEGIGARWFETDDPNIQELVELSFEIRIVDDVFWFKVTDGIDENWGGFNVDE